MLNDFLNELQARQSVSSVYTDWGPRLKVLNVLSSLLESPLLTTLANVSLSTRSIIVLKKGWIDLRALE